MSIKTARKESNSIYEYDKITKKSNVVLNIIFILVVLSCVLPLMLILIISLTDEQAVIMNGYSFFPKKWSVSAYKYLFARSSGVLRAYGVTIFATTVGTFLSLLITTLFAYPLSRKSFKHRRFFSGFIYFTMLFSGGIVPWIIMYSQVIPIKNTIWALIIPSLMSAWNVMLMRTFMSGNIPDEILESSRIDGASELRVFFTIVIPLSVAGLATIGLFSILAFWNDWYLPMIFITDPGLSNIQYLMYSMLNNVMYLSSMASTNPNAIMALRDMPAETIRMAVAVIAIGPVIFAYPFFQRFFVKGLTVGSVKG